MNSKSMIKNFLYVSYLERKPWLNTLDQKETSWSVWVCYRMLQSNLFRTRRKNNEASSDEFFIVWILFTIYIDNIEFLETKLKKIYLGFLFLCVHVNSGFLRLSHHTLSLSLLLQSHCIVYTIYMCFMNNHKATLGIYFKNGFICK